MAFIPLGRICLNGHNIKEEKTNRCNLNAAIDIAMGCLYNLNRKYAPAPDRAAYYSYELEKRPLRYENLLKGLMNIKLGSMINYRNMERLFRSRFLRFLSESDAVLGF